MAEVEEEESAFSEHGYGGKKESLLIVDSWLKSLDLRYVIS